MPVDAVLFDLDETLADWTAGIRLSVGELVGDDAADRLLAYAKAHLWRRRDGAVVARNTWQLHEFADRTWVEALPELDPDELALVIKRFRNDLWVPFFPDAVPCLDVLVDRYRLGILSNNPYVVAEVDRLRLRDWFETYPVLPPGPTKPDPDAFTIGCASLGAPPARVAHVGDSIDMDVEGALAAGLLPVWLDRADEPWTPPEGVHRITTLAELPDLLASL